MSTDANKRPVQRYLEEIVNTGKVGALPQFISPDYVEVFDNARHAAGLEGARQHILGVRETYPGLHLTVERQIAEGGWVVTCVTARGTHSGRTWLGLRPTRKRVEFSAVNVDRGVNGLIVEHGGAANLFDSPNLLNEPTTMNADSSPLVSAPRSTAPPSGPRRRPKLKLALLGALGVLLVALLAGAAWLLHRIWWTVPFLQETGLLVWIAALVLALAVTALLAGLKFRQAWRRSSARTAPVWVMLAVAIALGGWLWHRGELALHEFLPRVVKLDLPSLLGPVPTYYDHGAKARAERLQADLREMNGFYQEKLGVQAAVTLAVLNSNQWTRVNPVPFGLPGVLGEPPVIFAPAHSGGWAFRQMLARKDSIPADVLQDYLRTTQKTFEAASDDFVDVIALHELGHVLLVHYGIDPGCHWLNEFVASYFACAFVAERRPERTPVIALVGRPSQTRPKHTTLADLERLYVLVDDYGWYQGMFERRIQEMYPQAGLQFLKDLKRVLPRTAGIPEGGSITDPVVNRLAPEVVVEKLEAIAPGFQAWAKGFQK